MEIVQLVMNMDMEELNQQHHFWHKIVVSKFYALGCDGVFLLRKYDKETFSQKISPPTLGETATVFNTVQRFKPWDKPMAWYATWEQGTWGKFTTINQQSTLTFSEFCCWILIGTFVS